MEKHTEKHPKPSTDPLNMAYPTTEDIYEQSQLLPDADPEDVSKTKSLNTDDEDLNNEKDFDEDKSGDDLDTEGAEKDGPKTKTGAEDEENEYYSLGGDEHNDLEEDKGD